MPPNLQEVKLRFARRRTARVMGSLAEREREPDEGESVRGILVTHNFQSKLVAPEDLATYTPLRVGSIATKLHVPFVGSLETLRLFLTEMFAGITESAEQRESVTVTTFELTTEVKVILGAKEGVATVEWIASPQGDILADAVVALLMHAQSSAASIRLTSKPCRHQNDKPDPEEQPTKRVKQETSSENTESRLRFVYTTLKDQFENVDALFEGNKGSFEITLDASVDDEALDEDGKMRCTVSVEFHDSSGTNATVLTECKDEAVANNVRTCLRNIAEAMAPIPTTK